jgi:predicted acylesterase/phospholipase RssA
VCKPALTGPEHGKSNVYKNCPEAGVLIMSRRIAVFLAAVFLASCVSPRKDIPSSAVPWGALLQDEYYTNFVDDLGIPRRPILQDHNGDGRLVILALSGGGSYGAFGAGVLKGWTESGFRPEADIVTGVSTGALLATHTFLGPDFDDAAGQIYTSITNRGIYERRALVAVPFSSSLVDQRPLRELLETVISERIVDQVAHERRSKGRQLLVASTDLDNARIVIWDLSSIAVTERPDRRKRYIDALMASSAIPGFFEPILIDATVDGSGTGFQLHVDGSVATSIFVPRLAEIGSDSTLEVYALINTQLESHGTKTPTAMDALSVSRVALNAVLRTVAQRSAYDLFLATTFAGGKFRMIGIPKEHDLPFPPYEFQRDAMNALYQAGIELGRTNRWLEGLPRLDSLATQVRFESSNPDSK